MAWYSGIVISSLTYFNWFYDLWFNFRRRLDKAYAAYSSQEGIWHIYDRGGLTFACPSEFVYADQPQYIFDAKTNHLIDTSAGVVDYTQLRLSNFIGGSLYYDGASQEDMTDFISMVRIFGVQPPARVLVWAWALMTSREKLGWLASRREPFEVRMMDDNAEDVIFNL